MLITVIWPGPYSGWSANQKAGKPCIIICLHYTKLYHCALHWLYKLSVFSSIKQTEKMETKEPSPGTKHPRLKRKQPELKKKQRPFLPCGHSGAAETPSLVKHTSTPRLSFAACEEGMFKAIWLLYQTRYRKQTAINWSIGIANKDFPTGTTLS